VYEVESFTLHACGSLPRVARFSPGITDDDKAALLRKEDSSSLLRNCDLSSRKARMEGIDEDIERAGFEVPDDTVEHCVISESAAMTMGVSIT